MSSSTNMHSKEGWTAKSKQLGTSIWVSVKDGEGNEVTFFFKYAVAADRVAAGFNYKATTENGETE